MSAPISADLRGRLADTVFYRAQPEILLSSDRCLAIVDAIVAALIAEGWRDMRLVESPEALAAYRAATLRDVVADDEASAGGDFHACGGAGLCLCRPPSGTEQ